MSNDNGDDGKLTPEPTKTEEQLASERFSRYQKDPITFIELSDLICGVVRNPKSQLGVSVFIGIAKRSEIDIAEIELVHRISLTRRQMDIEAEMLHQSKIVPAKHGIFDFARKRK